MIFDERMGTARVDMPCPRHASFSSLDAWMQCPGRWAASRLMPKPREWGSPLVLGGIAHAALESACAAPDVSTPDWLALCRRGIDVEYARWRERGWGDEPIPADAMLPDGRVATRDDWARLAAGKLSGFALTDALGRPPSPAALEQELHVDVDGIPLAGSVDYRDLDGTVVDWKTGRVPSRRDGRERHADQLRAYRLMLEESGVCEVRAARDVYVEHRAWREADLSDAACTDTLSRFHRAWDGMTRATGPDGDGILPLVPSGLCAWCPVAAACPLARIIPAGRMEAATSVRADDPRIGFVRTHTTGNAPVGGDGDKESRMSDGIDLLALIGDATPAAKPKGPAGVPGPKYPDPWETPQGRATLDKWGVGGKAETKPAEGPADPWASPASPATDDPWNPKPKTGGKPGPAAVSGPGGGTADRPDGFLLGERRPYDPTLDGTHVNVAGYGFAQLNMTFAHAAVLADGHDDRIRPLAMAMLKSQWAIARSAFGPIVPDVPGLADGRPEPAALFKWLDSTLCRDADRVLRMQLDNDPLLGPGESDTLEARLQRVSDAAHAAGVALSGVIGVLKRA